MSFDFVILEGIFQGRIIKVADDRMRHIRPFVDRGKIKAAMPQHVENFFKAGA